MEEEVKALLKVSAMVALSMTYARFASLSIGPGKARLAALLPIVILLPLLPWCFSSVNLRAISTFFFACYAPFKLLLLSFGLGQLTPSLPLATFVAISFLPVRLHSPKSPPSGSSSFLLIASAFKSLIISFLASLYHYRTFTHPYLLASIGAAHIFLVLDFGTIFAAALAALLLGLQVELLHDEPQKSDSLQDFWGRRWNLVVAAVTRPAIYLPLRARYGTAVGFLATFLFSGLMHEVMFYYITLARPTGEVSCFFLLHALCTLAEATARRRRRSRSRKVHSAMAGPLALAFVVVTAVWLFFPSMTRGGAAEKSIEESVAVMRYLDSWRKKGVPVLPADSIPLDDVFM